jgi:hypothetical protein
VIVVMVTAGAYRMTSRAIQPDRFHEVNWRRHESAYYHERRTVMLLIAAVIWGPWIPAMVSESAWWLLVRPMFWFGPTYLTTLVGLVAVYAAFRRRRPAADSQPIGPPTLRMSCFCAVWTAMFLTAMLGIPVLVLLSFAVWFNPWYLGP